MRSKTILTISILGFFLFTLPLSIFGWVWANDTCIIFPQGCSPGEGTNGLEVIKGSSPSIGQLIIEGAGYFVKSHSDFQKFQNKVELSELNGLDYTESTEILNSAIENVQNALRKYEMLISIAKVMPYREDVVEKLENFDYDGFQIEKGLNQSVFKNAQAFLIVGDVTGMYVKLKSDMDLISKRLIDIRRSIDESRFPEIPILWDVNQMFAQTQLLGQYASQVCYEIKKENEKAEV